MIQIIKPNLDNSYSNTLPSSIQRRLLLLHVLVVPDELTNVFFEHRPCSIFLNICIILITRHVFDHYDSLVFHFTEKVIVHVHVSSPTLNAPAVCQVNCTFVIHLKDHWQLDF